MRMRLVDDTLELKYLFIDAKYDKDDVDESDAYRKSMDKFYNMALTEPNMPTKGIDEKRLLSEFGRLKRKIQEQKEEREKQENERKQLLEDMEREREEHGKQREEMTKKGAKEKIRINKLEKENTDLRQQHTRILNAVEKQQNDLEELKKRNQRIREESIFSKIFNFF